MEADDVRRRPVQRATAPSSLLPTALARRQSSSYKHLRKNNLVSNSPFKSPPSNQNSNLGVSSSPSSLSPNLVLGSAHTKVHLPLPRHPSTTTPTPTARRVSIEKRPRPDSMHEQAETENDRPVVYKKDRKDSKSIQGLAEKEPIGKSPFLLRRRKGVSDADINQLDTLGRQAVAAVDPPADLAHEAVPTNGTTDGNATAGGNGGTNASPARSSLVSKRLHGPRISSTGFAPLTGRRARRKTVTFDERCDVVEFEREEEEDGAPGEYRDVFHSDEGEDPQEQPQLSSGNEDEATDADSEEEPLNIISSLLHPAAKHHGKDYPDDLLSRAQDLLKEFHDPEVDHDGENILTNDIGNGEAPGPGVGSKSPDSQHRPQFEIQSLRQCAVDENASDDDDTLRHDPNNVDGIREERTSFAFDGDEADEEPEDIDDHEQSHDHGGPGRLSLSLPLASLQASLGFRHIGLGIGSGIGIGPERERDEDATGERRSDESRISSRATSPRSKRDSRRSSAEVGDTSYSSHDDVDVSVALEEKPDLGAGVQSSPPTAFKQAQPLSIITGRKTSSPLVSSSPLVPNPRLRSSSGGARIGDSPGSRSRPIDKEDVRRRLGLGRSSPPNSSASATATQTTTPLSSSRGARAEAEDPSEKEKDESLSLNTSLSGEEGVGLRTRKRISSLMSLSPSFVKETVEATVERARKVYVSPGSGVASGDGDATENGGTGIGIGVGMGGLSFDFGGRLSLGLGTLGSGAGSEPGPEPGHVGAGKDELGVELGDMRSALDRLMDDVAGTNGRHGRRRRPSHRRARSHSDVGRDRDGSTDGNEGESSCSESEQSVPISPTSPLVRPPHARRAATDPGHGQSEAWDEDDDSDTDAVLPSPASSIPPPVPPKDARKEREELILAQRRLTRRLEEEERMGFASPPRLDVRIGNGDGKGLRRRSGRRSRSTGDVMEDVGVGLLNVAAGADATRAASDGDELGDSIERELKRLEGVGRSKYHVREREGTIYASSSASSALDDTRRGGGGDSIGHVGSAGDVDGGRAWRVLRRPSDMNEYSKQIKQLRAQEKPGKAHGKVFVKVLGTKGLQLPLTQQPTAVTCTLNNGIHFVTTPEIKLGPDCKIVQEFELIEHSKLEFTLTLKVRRDTHIIAQFKALAVPPAAPPVSPASKGGMRGFFSSSHKKSASKDKAARAAPTPTLPENLARYLKPDGTLARAFISFKEIAHHCDTRLFETTYPLIGQKMEVGGAIKTIEIGEIILEIFRLPPLPGIPQDKLPQSLEECHRGLRHVNWHKVTYFEGVLTQNGGDCTTWRRRQFRVVGASLIAYNDVTKRAITTIDLKKAISIIDDQDESSGHTSSRHTDEYDGLYGVERSFKLIFPHDQEIAFFADTDDEKAKWLEVLRALVGHIPPNPLWAELAWQRQDDLAKAVKSSTVLR